VAEHDRQKPQTAAEKRSPPADAVFRFLATPAGRLLE
jgi:hypothetical protein